MYAVAEKCHADAKTTWSRGTKACGKPCAPDSMYCPEHKAVALARLGVKSRPQSVRVYRVP